MLCHECKLSLLSDVHPPKLFSCPENVYVFENEIVEWSEPKATDNVGVAESVCTNKQNGKVFPLGEHRISCDVWDYERNKASCYFHVVVIKEGTMYMGFYKIVVTREKVFIFDCFCFHFIINISTFDSVLLINQAKGMS